jgi:hypothetical protein
MSLEKRTLDEIYLADADLRLRRSRTVRR